MVPPLASSVPGESQVPPDPFPHGGEAPAGPSPAPPRPSDVGSGVLKPERIIRLEADRVVLLDQRRLPDAEVELECRSAAEVAEAIRGMAVRGAPAIGIAAAYGYALAAARGDDLGEAAALLEGSRATAANLGWALRAVRGAADPEAGARALPAE